MKSAMIFWNFHVSAELSRHDASSRRIGDREGDFIFGIDRDRRPADGNLGATINCGTWISGFQPN